MKLLGRNVTRRPTTVPVVLLCSVVLAAFALLPMPPVHSRKVDAAYSNYVDAPSQETRLALQNTIERANLPFHILQYVSGVSALGLLTVVALRRSIKRRGESGRWRTPGRARS
jgi:hypothetical protein